MKNKEEMIETLKKFSTSKLGAIGEYIFKNHIKDEYHKDIVPLHKERTDFIWEGKRIDVKASLRYRDKDSNYPKMNKYYGNKLEDRYYVQVLFYKNEVVISETSEINGLIPARLDYSYIINLYYSNSKYKEWEIYRNTKIKLYLEERNKRLTIFKDQIMNLFHKNLNIKNMIRIIYRTVDFGKNDSPHNLRPKLIFNNNITVFIKFDEDVMMIERIYAFKDTEIASFKNIQNPRFTDNKIDLQAIDPKYIYNDIEDLLNNWHKNQTV